MNPAEWRGRRVLLTGHTGFKGTWLTVWLHAMGARVAGYSLDPSTVPSMFDAVGARHLLQDHRGDVRDTSRLADLAASFDPEIVFHLAAQPLVRRGYREPVETYSVNVVGTASVLEAARRAASLRAVVVVTTDKCYENRNWVWGYREDDSLGGHDPYSSSKACAELVTDTYRRSFFETLSTPVGVATARAGNVVGGGDWGEDRLVPDAARAVAQRRPLRVRMPDAVRPWQHVLEPLYGYLLLAQGLLRNPVAHAGAWNFGPAAASVRTVAQVLASLSAHWQGRLDWSCDTPGPQAYEAHRLTLDSSKANLHLGWRSRLDIDAALERTVEWYEAVEAGGHDMLAFTRKQIAAYLAILPGQSAIPAPLPRGS